MIEFYLYFVVIRLQVGWMSDCSPVIRQEAHFASSNCNPLCINRNQAKYPFLQLSHFLSYSLVKCLHRQLFVHLFGSKLGKYFSVSWNKLKIITLNVVSCYGSVLLFIAFFFPQKMSAVFDLPMMSDFHELYFLFHSLIGAGWKEKPQYIHNMLTTLTSQRVFRRTS